MNVLDLFSGIGGFSLGLERAGMRTVAFCEIDPYCRAVLRRHWPDVPIFGDVRTLTAARLMADAQRNRCDHQPLTGTSFPPTSGAESEEPQSWRITDAADHCGIDVICGGFPCQDISVAGKGAGIGAERSGLWSEYARIIGEVRPRYVIVENVAALLGRGIERVLGDLAALGYDAEWHCIPASAVGAPHRRDRVWIVAYAAQLHSDGCGNHTRGDSQGTDAVSKFGNGFGHADVADANGAGCIEQWRPLPIQAELTAAQCNDWWFVEPNVGRVAHGVPARVDRLRALGNAVVPQIPEIIGRAIMSGERDG